MESIETKYLAALLSPITRQIMPLVPIILDLMCDNYGCITLQKLDNKTTIIKSMNYHLAQSIDLIFKSINDLVKYDLAAEA